MMHEYEVVFATSTPFFEWFWSYDREKERYLPRLTACTLDLRPSKLFAKLDTPAGVGVLWRHGDWMGQAPAVGRVRKMETGDGRCTGVIAVSEALLGRFAPDGVESLDKGVNAGISLGFRALEYPWGVFTRGEGTFEKPDRMQYGRILVREASLTPVPRILDAGVVRKLSGPARENTGEDE